MSFGKQQMQSLLGIPGTKRPQRALGSPLLPGLVPPPPARPAPSLKHQQQLGYALVRVTDFTWTLVLLPEMPYFFISIYKLLGILSMTLTLITLRAGGSFHQDRHFTQRYCPVAAGLLLHMLLACRPEQMLRYCLGEPGLVQKQLSRFLKANGS